MSFRILIQYRLTVVHGFIGVFILDRELSADFVIISFSFSVKHFYLLIGGKYINYYRTVV